MINGKPIKFNIPEISLTDRLSAANLPPGQAKVMIEGHWDPCDCERCQGIRAQERILLEGQS